MDILFIVSALYLITVVKGSNYDAFLADLELRNREEHDRFRRKFPNGDLVLNHVLNSPEFRSIHPVLQEYEGPEDFNDGETSNSWSRLMDSLAFAEEIARHPDPEIAKKRLLLRITEHATNNTPVRITQRSEYAPQNILSGPQSISGGSAEHGSWIDYAISGAMAQDDDDNDDKTMDKGEENHANGLVSSPLFNNFHKSKPKTDELRHFCDPPNPCPLGYDPDSLTTPCDMNFENTELFNKLWNEREIISGECTCDTQHMFNCDKYTSQKTLFGSLTKNRQKEIVYKSNPYLRGQKRSNDVARKGRLQWENRYNRYSEGENLRSIVKKSGPNFDQA